jgi:hypothetical protein
VSSDSVSPQPPPFYPDARGRVVTWCNCWERAAAKYAADAGDSYSVAVSAVTPMMALTHNLRKCLTYVSGEARPRYPRAPNAIASGRPLSAMRLLLHWTSLPPRCSTPNSSHTARAP